MSSSIDLVREAAISDLFTMLSRSLTSPCFLSSSLSYVLHDLANRIRNLKWLTLEAFSVFCLLSRHEMFLVLSLSAAKVHVFLYVRHWLSFKYKRILSGWYFCRCKKITLELDDVLLLFLRLFVWWWRHWRIRDHPSALHDKFGNRLPIWRVITYACDRPCPLRKLHALFCSQRYNYV